jgi:hypothetical protein
MWVGYRSATANQRNRQIQAEKGLKIMRRTLVTIAAVAMIAPTASAQQQQLTKPTTCGRLLNTMVEVNFTGSPFRDVVDYLSVIGSIDILANWSEDAFSDGFDPTAPITLKLQGSVALIDALVLAMDQATDDEASWVLGDGFIRIGTKDELNQDRYVVIYPIQELLFEPKRFDNAPQIDLQAVFSGGESGEITSSIFDIPDRDGDEIDQTLETVRANKLVDIITSIIDPFQWEVNGGDGGDIRYFRGHLIINATDYLHRQVGGYPFRIPNASSSNARTASVSDVTESRCVSLTGRWGQSKVVDVDEYQVPILVAGDVVLSGSGGDGG